MNKQKKNIQKKAGNTPSTKPKLQAAVKQLPNSRGITIAAIACVSLITFICFHYSVHNQFLNWDDGVYIFNDKYIKNFSSENLRMMLFHSITPSNYHPFAMLTLALNYHFSQLHPYMYYLTNILIHISNVILVFLLSEKLLCRLKIEERSSIFMAALCALWFGIHPMHVESVSWVSERKDVLYTFFYLIGLRVYINYIDSRNTKWYLLTLLLFITSCLSKPMAVTFPLTLFAFDLILGRKFELPSSNKLGWGIFTEKTPFFIVSLFFGVLAYHIQQGSGAVLSFHAIPFFNRIIIACYGYVMYLVKFIWPFNLSAFYPYPDIRPQIPLPAVFYMMPFVVIIINCIPFYFKWKKNERLYRITLFGLSFYFFNIVFVSQFISCGDTVISERYSYVSYIGIIFMVVYLLNEFIVGKPSLKNPVIGVIAGASLLFSVLCYERTKVWHSPETFWPDVIAKSNRQSQLPYLNFGNYYADSGKYDKAYVQYAILTKLGVTDPIVFRNLGNIYGMRKQFDSSLYCFGMAIKYDSTEASIYNNRGITYANLGKLDLALKDFKKAYSIDTTQSSWLVEVANISMQLGRLNEAIADYSKLIKREPQELSYYLMRGTAYLNGGDAEAALQNYMAVLQLKPDNGECMYDISVAYNMLKDKVNALKYATMAKTAGYSVSDSYMNLLK